MAEQLVKLDITATERTDGGELRCKLSENDSTGVVGDAAMWGIDGFYSRPNDPDDRGACQALLAYEGNNRRVIATKDNRIVGEYATLAPGDRAVCTDGPAKLLVKKDGGTVTMATATPNDELVMVQTSPTAITIMMPGDGGTAMVQAKAGRIVLMVDGGGSIIIDKAGVHIGGNICEVSTGMVTLGMLAPNVPLVPSINSAIVGPSGMIGVPSTKVLIAP